MELVQNSAANGSTMGTYSMKQCRSAADMGMEDEQGGSMHKLARKEPFGYLKMGMNSAAAAGQNGNGVLFRANSLVGDGRMVCSPTNSCLSDSPVLIGPADMGDSRFLRTDSSGFGPGRNFSYHPQNYQYSSAGLMSREIANHMGMQGLMRSPFTANQWAELEHQALIFKYMMAGANVPPELLNPIRRSVALSGLITHPALRMGWGNFHLGMAANPDPEPGRCRRTDGKKWRCSKEVVPDQKYCDRHMHRGRNRAKKNAENQNAAAAAASGASNSNSSQISSSTTNPAITQGVKSAASLNASFGSKSYGGLSSDSTATNQYALPIPAASKDYRYMNRAEIFQDGNASHPAVDPWKVQGEAEKPNSILQYNSFRVPGQRAYDAIAIGRDCPVDEQPLRHFFDDWPRSTRDPPTLSWPDLDPKPDPPQLSISSSSLLNYASPPSPSRGKLTLSPLKLSMSRADDDPDADIGLGINLGFHHRPSQHHQHSWIPLEAASVGGPLGEVLHSGTNKGSSALTLLPDGWTEDSPKNNGSNLASPTAVLTKAPFGAFSDSSSNASSPRAETALLAAVAHRVKTQDQ